MAACASDHASSLWWIRMPLTSFPCPSGWSTASAPSLTLSTIEPSPRAGSSPRSPGGPNSPLGVSTAWLSEENNLFVESLPSLPMMPRRPGATLGKEPDDPSKRVSPDFEKVRSEIATHRRLDFLARRRHAAASFAAEAQKTTKVLDQRDAEVREFERKRREAYEAERQRREAERRATMDRLIEEYKQKEAMWEEEKELYEQTWQTRQSLRERELDEKNKRLQEKATQKDAERKAFLQRKQEQDEAKDR